MDTKDMRAYQRWWYKEHKEQLKKKHQARFKRDSKYRYRLRSSHLKSYYKCKSKTPKYNISHGEYIKVYRKRLRQQIIVAYGSKCACCGETMNEFLTPDHINGGGREHLRRRGTIGIYRDIIREGFPKDKYQLLCMNCNWAKSVYGVCPHVSRIK